MTNDKRRGQQIEQSKKWITEALLSLMEEKPFPEITISEVTKRADLSRRTFYRHYHSLEEVLSEYILTLCKNCLDVAYLPDIYNFSFSKLFYDFFTFWDDHRLFLKAVKNSPFSFNHMKRIFDVIHHQKIENNPELGTPFAEYAYTFITAGLWIILMEWASEENPATPQEMVEMTYKIAKLFQRIP